MDKLWELVSGNWKLTFSYLFVFAGGGVVVALLIGWWDGIATLGAILGFAGGWATGILLAPYEEEQKRFQKLSKVVSGFIAGFAAGKIDRVFDLAVDERKHPALILDPYFSRPVWMAIACFLLTAIAVFVTRTYAQLIDAE